MSSGRSSGFTGRIRCSDADGWKGGEIIFKDLRLSRETLGVIERGREQVERGEGITLEELRAELDAT